MTKRRWGPTRHYLTSDGHVVEIIAHTIDHHIDDLVLIYVSGDAREATEMLNGLKSRFLFKHVREWDGTR